MANTVRILRSASTNTPASLDQGEVAYSEDGSPNGEGELFIGTAGASVTKITTTVLTGTDGVAAQPNSSAQDNQTITTGTGIDGADAGDTGDITLSLAFDELGVTVPVAGDWLCFDDAGVSSKALISSIPLSLFTDDLGHVENAVHTGDVAGGTVLTIQPDAVEYSMIQNVVANNVMLGNNAGAGGIVDELTGTEVTALLDLATTSLKGLSPVLSNVATQFLNGTGAWSTPAGGGDVSWNAGTAPADNALVRFDGITGQLIQESSIIIDDSDNVTGMGTLNGKTIANLVSTDDAGSSSWNWILDEDAMGSDSATHVPTQQSVKAYVDNAVTGALTHKGGYNADTNTPALDTGSPTLEIGDMYTVTVAGLFFTVAVEIGDVLISDVDSVDAAAVTDWTIVQSNIGAASETVAGYIQLATQAEMDTATDDAKAVTPLKYANSIIDCGTF